MFTQLNYLPMWELAMPTLISNLVISKVDTEHSVGMLRTQE